MYGPPQSVALTCFLRSPNESWQVSMGSIAMGGGFGSGQVTRRLASWV